MFRFLLLAILTLTTLNATIATQKNVTKLYLATFERAPDRAGLEYWLKSGLSLEEIAMSFFDQDETKRKYPDGTTVQKFIYSVYSNLFKRTPDSAGFNYWSRELEIESISKSTFILAVINGALGDDSKILENRTTVALVFVSSGNNSVADAISVIKDIGAETTKADATKNDTKVETTTSSEDSSTEGESSDESTSTTTDSSTGTSTTTTTDSNTNSDSNSDTSSDEEESDTTLEDALSSGDASNVSLDTLYEAIENLDNSYLNRCKESLSSLYGDATISNITKEPFDSKTDQFVSLSTNNIPLHGGKKGDKYLFYSFMGENLDGTRYAMLGTLLSNFKPSLKESTTELFKWLMKRESSSDIYSENLTIATNSGGKSDLESWLSKNSITTNWTIRDDISISDGDYDLYVARAETTNNYKLAQNAKRPVILFDKPSYEQREYFNLEYTTWDDTAGAWDSIDEICAMQVEEQKKIDDTILGVINLIKENKIDISYSSVSLFGDVVATNNSTNNSIQSDILDGIDNLRAIISKLDRGDIDIFSSSRDEDKFIKLAILIGDKYRESISYPMDKESTDDTTFFKALFADASVSYARDNNRYQPNLGDFSPHLTELLQEPVSDETLTLTPNAFDAWTSTGFYALPSQKIIIKRTDSSDNIIKLKFNMQRINSTRMWEKDSYTRPRFISSHEIDIESGREYTLSSPYGGAIYIHWRGVESDPQPFTIEFKNVAKHPTLIVETSDFSKTKVDEYEKKLKDTPFSWTDIKTPFLEIHTLVDYHKRAYTTEADGYYNGNMQLYFDELKEYLVEDVLGVAGYQGDGLVLNDNMSKWCSDNEIDCTNKIHQKPKIQHIISDYHSLAAGGTSGNPFDMGDPLTIYSGAAVHEYGHNLQRNLLKFYGGYSTEVTNNIFTHYVSYMWAKNNNEEYAKYAWNNYPKAYNALTKAVKDKTEANAGTHPLWLDSESHQDADSRQALLSHITFLNGGYDIYTKLYIIERLFREAIKSDNSWSENKSKLGFSSYSRDEAKELDNWQNLLGGNDFMSIVLSNINQKDYRAFFDIWGMKISDKAKKQIETNGISKGTIPTGFYIFRDDKNLLLEAPTKTIPIDGANLLLDKSITKICTDTGIDNCRDGALIYSFDKESTFGSMFEDNGDISKLRVKTKDGTTINLEVSTKNGELAIWIESSKNSNLDTTQEYTIAYDAVPYIEVKSGDEVTDRVKVRFNLDKIKSE